MNFFHGGGEVLGIRPNGRNTHINFREGSFDWKLKVLVHFLSITRYWRVASSPPPQTSFFPDASNKNFKCIQ